MYMYILPDCLLDRLGTAFIFFFRGERACGSDKKSSSLHSALIQENYQKEKNGEYLLESPRRPSQVRSGR